MPQAVPLALDQLVQAERTTLVVAQLRGQGPGGSALGVIWTFDRLSGHQLLSAT